MTQRVGIGGWVFSMIFAVIAALSWLESLHARRDAEEMAVELEGTEHQLYDCMFGLRLKPPLQQSDNP